MYTGGSVSDDKAVAAAVIDNYSSIEHLPNKSIFSAESQALYLALDRVGTPADEERHFIIFNVCSSGHFRPRLEASSCPQCTTKPSLASTVQREKKNILLGPSHVGIIGNEKADPAAKASLLRRVFRYSNSLFINALLKRKWQSQWDEAVSNKLNEIHPQLGLWPGGSRIIRREESILARIQIGHTHLTHCFLLKKEDPPQCVACDCRLTVKHKFRNRHFNVNSFKEVFEKITPDSILSYLHEIGLFYRL